MKVVNLKALTKEHGLRGYSKLKKAELIIFPQNNLQPTPAPCTKPTAAPHTKHTPAPRTKPIPAPCTKPIPAPSTKPIPAPCTKPIPAPCTKPPQASPSVRFKPDRPRQPSDSHNPRPYQLKPKEVR